MLIITSNVYVLQKKPSRTIRKIAMKRALIIGGGTFNHVRPHFSLAAPAFGTVARALFGIVSSTIPEVSPELILTKMAGNEHTHNPKPNICTNEDLQHAVDQMVSDESTKIIFFTAAVCDWKGDIIDYHTSPEQRLDTRNSNNHLLSLTPSAKIVKTIREQRKDIFLVAFKMTSGATEDEQYIAGLNLCKEASCNLVFANDTKTRLNMIIAPEETRYCVTKDRHRALVELCEMVKHRHNLTYTRSTVVDGNLRPWTDKDIPPSLRTVVNYCIKQGAYKAFRGSTAGHFAVKLTDTTFLTSARRTDYNNLNKTGNGLVYVESLDDTQVKAVGAKPSVGGQSQRLIFKDHPDVDCIVHFHCPLRIDPTHSIPTAKQREFECGSHECGQNTSDNLQEFGNIKCVYLENHGPNIAFNKDIDPYEVIKFIEGNFELKSKTGGLVCQKLI